MTFTSNLHPVIPKHLTQKHLTQGTPPHRKDYTMPPSIQPSPRRNRGAPRGNHNALKHGFYSRFFTRQEREHLDKDMAGEFRDEELLLDIIINRAWEAIHKMDLPGEEWLAAVRIISQAIGRKESLVRSRRLIFERAATVEDAFEELSQIPVEED